MSNIVKHSLEDLVNFMSGEYKQGAERSQYFYCPDITVYARNTEVGYKGVLHKAIVIANVTVAEDKRNTGIMTDLVERTIEAAANTKYPKTLVILESASEQLVSMFAGKETTIKRDDAPIPVHHQVKFKVDDINGEMISPNLVAYVQAIPPVSHYRFEATRNSDFSMMLLSFRLSPEPIPTEILEEVDNAFPIQVFTKRLESFGYTNSSCGLLGPKGVSPEVRLLLILILTTPADSVMFAYDIAWYMYNNDVDYFTQFHLHELYQGNVPSSESLMAYWDKVNKEYPIKKNALDHDYLWPKKGATL